MIIVFEGIDGSGKTTQAHRLDTYLRRRNVETACIEWYSFMVSRHGGLLHPALAQAEWLKHRGSLGPLAFSLWHAADLGFRWEAHIQPALAAGKVVILDRYKYTAIVHDLVRGGERSWLEQLYRFAPEPSIVFFFDVAPAIALRRIVESRKAPGRYESGLDINPGMPLHEGFLWYQADCRRRYEAVLPRELTLTIDASHPEEVVFDRICTRVLQLLQGGETNDAEEGG